MKNGNEVLEQVRRVQKVPECFQESFFVNDPAERTFHLRIKFVKVRELSMYFNIAKEQESLHGTTQLF